MNPPPPLPPFDVGVIGAGPAGLMAAEVIAQAGWRVRVFDASPSAGRKLLLAGRGGLNLTRDEPDEVFLTRYHGGGPGSAEALAAWLAAFGPRQLRAWCAGLGIDTVVGSSGRVFPAGMKAAPLLRAWLHRLRADGVRFSMRHRWAGWGDDGQPRFALKAGGAAPFAGEATAADHRAQEAAPAIVPPPRAWVLALGGGSWPRLGSDGAWVALLRQRGVTVADLLPANCGFEVATRDADGSERRGWSAYLAGRYAGAALKNVAASLPEAGWRQPGELVLTQGGLEGPLVYAAASRLRQILARDGRATLWLDLLPAYPPARVRAEVTQARGARSWASHLKSRLNLGGAKLALLHEVLAKNDWRDAAKVAATISALPIDIVAARPLDEAISSAGGVGFDALSAKLELRALPGVFCAGEMLDWDAPTGGYLLTACLASGRAAGFGVLASLRPESS